MDTVEMTSTPRDCAFEEMLMEVSSGAGSGALLGAMFDEKENALPQNINPKQNPSAKITKLHNTIKQDAILPLMSLHYRENDRYDGTGYNQLV